VLKQYALDPEVVDDSSAFTAFVNGLGIENGRIMAEYPRSWIRMAVERVRSMPSSRDQKRAELLVSRLRTNARLKYRTGLAFDGTNPWLTNAARHANEFDAVIHVDDVEPEPPSDRMYPATSLLDDEAFWRVDRHAEFLAKPGALRELLLPLTSMGNSLAVMDPYFDPHRDAYVAGLKEITALLSGPRRVVIHASGELPVGKAHVSPDDWEAACTERLQLFADPTSVLTVVRWVKGPTGDQPHQRWLVTPLGGVLLDRGIALDLKRNSATLMGADMATGLWEQYGEPPFKSEAYRIKDVVHIACA
jgi:hypothetical protein